MTRRVVLFEDRQWASLRPLTELLPVPALVFGASDLARRWLARAGAPLLAIEARGRALATWHDAPARDTGSLPADTDVIVLNAAALPGGWYEAALEAGGPALWIAGGRIAGARLPLARLAPVLGRGALFEPALPGLELPAVSVNATFLSFPWHFIEHNAGAMTADLALERGEVRGDVHRLACLEAPERITVAEGAVVSEFAVLDARGGPIRIGPGARVASHTVVTGPCVLGAGTQLLGGFVSGTAFGPECRIAGEVEASLWQGYANKRHHGFVGHSIVGEWVNLGALTTTSDLKNNYRNVRVWVDGSDIDSGSPKVGSFIGAHVKTGIGSLLPTGASIGTGANLFAGGRFAPRRTAPFAWWDGEGTVDHEIGRFLATARIACGRRGRVISPADEAACRELFDSTAGERRPMK